MDIEAVRTPDERFGGIPDYPWAPNYLDDLKGYENLRAHYLDVGPSDAQKTFLCLHGEPSWSYLYRKMIPIFEAAGHRVVAPDFLGFGKSDKPIEDEIYTFTFHREFLKAFIERLDLKNITIVVQDWGSLIGLTLPMEYPDRIDRIIAMNATLVTGVSPSTGFDDWKNFSATNPEFEVGALMHRATPILSEAEVAAYDAPFPDRTFKAGVRRFPAIVPVSPEMDGAALSKQAAGWLATEWTGQTFLAVGAQDMVLGVEVVKKLQGTIKGAPDPMQVDEGGHFVQEWGAPIAEAALAYFKDH